MTGTYFGENQFHDDEDRDGPRNIDLTRPSTRCWPEKILLNLVDAKSSNCAKYWVSTHHRRRTQKGAVVEEIWDRNWLIWRKKLGQMVATNLCTRSVINWTRQRLRLTWRRSFRCQTLTSKNLVFKRNDFARKGREFCPPNFFRQFLPQQIFRLDKHVGSYGRSGRRKACRSTYDVLLFWSDCRQDWTVSTNCIKLTM